ncbi:MAG TPA: UvrB/UvrC motif-containing protein, partial [Spirochaetia bacterium]|nr:UvrB/UvrC motif-containing protein [Spirochaetia bacterium]
QIMGSEVVELHLCEKCAAERGISSGGDKIELSLSQLLTGLVDTQSSGKSEKSAERCPNCEMTLADFRKDGRLGCSECYTAFKREIEVFLQNTSGTIRHKGKYPARLKAFKSLLIDREQLKDELKDAVTKEDYEKAAKIRDKIRTIEQTAGKQDD